MSTKTADWEQEEAKKRAEVEKMEAKEMFDSEYLPTLHQHGRALYRLENWAGALEVSEKVAGWHMQVSGDDSMQFAMALSNVGTTANRLGQTEIVSATMERAIGITIARFGETSYESTQIFAKMLQFGLYKGDEKPQGYSQEKYMEEIKRILDSETKGDESETEEL